MSGEDKEVDLHVDRDDLWRVFRHPVHGICLEAVKPTVGWYGITIRLNDEERGWLDAANFVELGRQADRLRAWPEGFRTDRPRVIDTEGREGR